MIKLEHVVLASPEQMEFMIEGMRNIDHSWEESDSIKCYANEKCQGICDENKIGLCVGNNNRGLMQRLANTGKKRDRKFLRMMPVYVRITAPFYWWNEFDSEYGEDVDMIPCSFMNKIQDKKFTLEDFSIENLSDASKKVLSYVIDELNMSRERYLDYGELSKSTKAKLNVKYPQYKKDIWWQIIQLLPNSYNETRNVMLNYAVLADIYESKRGSDLDEWHVHETPEEHKFRNKDFTSGKWGFCSWIEQLPYSELICGNGALMTPNEQRENIGLEPVEEPSESLKMVEVGKAASDGIRDGINRSDKLQEIVDKLNSIYNSNPMSVEDLEKVIKKASNSCEVMYKED